VCGHTLGRAKIKTSADGVDVLRAVGEDIRAFEAAYSVRLQDVVPAQFRSAAYGRLYDMTFGPR
jgi:hypothetical protein